LNIPKLQPVNAPLNRVENPQYAETIDNATVVPTTNLERTIYVNQLIIEAIQTFLYHNHDFDGDVRFMLKQKLQELKETVGEQKLSLELLKLLSASGGDKSVAADTLDKMIQRYLNDDRNR
jgi:hypothetical protein